MQSSLAEKVLWRPAKAHHREQVCFCLASVSSVGHLAPLVSLVAKAKSLSSAVTVVTKGHTVQCCIGFWFSSSASAVDPKSLPPSSKREGSIVRAKLSLFLVSNSRSIFVIAFRFAVSEEIHVKSGQARRRKHPRQAEKQLRHSHRREIDL